MILCVCAYLDDTSYVHLFITSKRYFHLLRSEPFLRTLFRDRRPQGLTLSALRRGLYNIIHSPTVTYSYGRKDNHYLTSYENLLIDMFERISLLRKDKIYYSTLRAKDGNIRYYRNGYFFINDKDELVITDKDLTVLDTIAQVDKCSLHVSETQNIIYRSQGVWYIYRKNEPIILETVLPAQDIAVLIVSVPSDTSRTYDIQFIIDKDKCFIHRDQVIAAPVKRVMVVDDDYYVYLTPDNSLYSITNDISVLVATNVVQFYVISRTAMCYISEGVMYNRIDGVVTTVTTDVGAVCIHAERLACYHKSTHLIAHRYGEKKIDADVIVKKFCIAQEGKMKYFTITTPELL